MTAKYTTAAIAVLAASAAHAHETSITIQGDQRCIASTGVPDHEVGTWRPGAVVEPQDHLLCVDDPPDKSGHNFGYDAYRYSAASGHRGIL